MLQVGAEAPDFTLKDQNGQPVTLSAFRGERSVLLVFFPLAFTGICQGELDEVRDHLADYDNADTATLAISVGPPPTHKVWATQSGFTFPVLSDFWPHGAVAQAYGVFNDETGFANRGTFVVDRSGVVRFAEMKGPGEARDQSLWTAALAALREQ
jgi:mycoredoxin-dependent peroxiredoxin